MLNLIKSLLVLSVSLVIIIYGAILNRLFEALLVIVMWLQLELGLRQFELQKASIAPQLTVKLEEKGERLLEHQWELILRNSGQSVAYCVSIVRVLRNGSPVPPNEWEKYIRVTKHCIDIPPSGEETVALISDPLALDGCVIEVWYKTVHERFDWVSENAFLTIHVLKNPNGTVKRVIVDTIPMRKRAPSPLMNSIEDLVELAKLLIFIRRLRKRY